MNAVGAGRLAEHAHDCTQNIHGVAPIAGLDGDEIGFLVAKIAEIKRQR
jgi:hypothetical protein